MDGARAAFVNAINIVNFNVNCFRLNNFTGDHFRNCCRTNDTSHVPEYLGLDGLKLYTPFINLTTVTCDPTKVPSILMPNADSAPRAIFNEL